MFAQVPICVLACGAVSQLARRCRPVSLKLITCSDMRANAFTPETLDIRVRLPTENRSIVIRFVRAGLSRLGPLAGK